MGIAAKLFALSREADLAANSVLIVEGKRDKRVLEILGFKNVLAISGKQLYEFIHKIPEHFNSAIILSDFDEEGEKIANHLVKGLHARGMNVNSALRNRLRSLFGIKKIEELLYLAKMKMFYDSGSIHLLEKGESKKKFSAKGRKRFI